LPRLLFENTRSRSGLHAARRIAVRVSSGGVEVVDPPVAGGRGTYASGRAGWADVSLAPGEYLVYLALVRDPRGRVSGRITVYDHQGVPVLEAVLRRRKVRRSRGDPGLSWVVEAALNSIGLSRYVRRYNWRTGSRV